MRVQAFASLLYVHIILNQPSYPSVVPFQQAENLYSFSLVQALRKHELSHTLNYLLFGSAHPNSLQLIFGRYFLKSAYDFFVQSPCDQLVLSKYQIHILALYPLQKGAYRQSFHKVMPQLHINPHVHHFFDRCALFVLVPNKPSLPLLSLVLMFQAPIISLQGFVDSQKYGMD